MVRARVKSYAGVLLAVLTVWLGVAGAQSRQANPHLESAVALYSTLDFDSALAALRQASSWPQNSPSDRVREALLEGLIHAQRGRFDEAQASFGRGLSLDPGAQLEFKAAPRIARLFEEERARVQARIASARAPDAPRLSAPPLPSEPAAPSLPPPQVVAIAQVSPPTRGWTYLALGASGAGLAAGVGLGLAATGASRELRSGVHPQAQAQALHDQTAKLASGANLAYGVAAAAGTTALVLWLLEPSTVSSPSPTVTR